MKTMTLCAAAFALLFYVVADLEMLLAVKGLILWVAAALWALLMWGEPSDKEVLGKAQQESKQEN